MLARVVLAPPGREPSSVRGVAAWRRLVTLQRSRVTVDVAADGLEGVHQVRSGPGEFIDARLPWAGEPGPRTVVSRPDSEGGSQPTGG
ncbi:hypothetical protein FHN55_16755 [Streptomyces sp. NP160]|uniref:hypothetical protein n=1 Tax=Streptomyces sp. NP160 TaxID=2586637 RepID=UPI0011199A96|nr:hypothetical protein [Streptomyces sp. NP160]TNM61958.1 hypothetical protein FHN55_16755 [Streptomyces sp. NP160]